MANPQKENGYTPIAHEIVEALWKINLSAYESRVLWYLFRKTYGWNKKTDCIPLSQFSKDIGLDRRLIYRAIHSLSSKKMIVIYKDDRNRLTYRFEKNYEKWNVSSKSMTVINTDDKGVSKSMTKVSSKEIPSKESIKENIKEKEKYLDYLFFTQDEYKKLTAKFNSRLPDVLDHMNAKIGQNVIAFNKKYKSHYFTILNWEKLGVFGTHTDKPKSYIDEVMKRMNNDKQRDT